jgi:cyclohexa-1,5-dienecarbonyl-CoA hydratase
VSTAASTSDGGGGRRAAENPASTASRLTVRVDDGIAQVVISDPPLNILTQALLTELRQALSRLADDLTLRVLLLRADGKHFSAGASVEEHLPGSVERMIPEFMETICALHHFPVPVICAVHGRCLGGAMEVALAADMLLAAEGALFGVPEISLGVLPPAACVQLPLRTSPGMAAELLFTGAPLGATEAKDAGLVLRVVPAAELMAEAMRLAESIAAHSAAALRVTKRTLRASTGSIDASMTEASRIYLHELMQTADAVEGLRSFTEKRKPEWSHS